MPLAVQYTPGVSTRPIHVGCRSPPGLNLRSVVSELFLMFFLIPISFGIGLIAEEYRRLSM